MFVRSAASLLIPNPGARISRVIGKSDTTAKRIGWQVGFLSRSLTLEVPKVIYAGPAAERMRGEDASRSTKRHSQWSDASRVPPCHWPPVHHWPADCATVPHRLSPAGYSLVESRFVGGYSCRVPVVLRAERDLFRSLHYHWRLFNSNRRADHTILCFQPLPMDERRGNS